MPNLVFSVFRLAIAPGAHLALSGSMPAMVLVHEGAIHVGGQKLDEGAGFYAPPDTRFENHGQAPALLVAFTLSEQPGVGAEAHEVIDVTFPCLWRLDEVSFPPGAVAYRHVHGGPGFRHLRRGALHLQADDHAFAVDPGATWFEAAQSPVRATAQADFAETRFVRSMILPVALLGKPSIRILDPDDAAQPRLQTTHRHVDQVIGHWPQVDAG